MIQITPIAIILNPTSITNGFSKICFESVFDKFKALTAPHDHKVHLQLSNSYLTKSEYIQRINAQAKHLLDKEKNKELYMHDIGERMVCASKDSYSLIKVDVTDIESQRDSDNNEPPMVIFCNVIGDSQAVENFNVQLFRTFRAERLPQDVPKLYPFILTIPDRLKHCFEDNFNCTYSPLCQVAILD